MSRPALQRVGEALSRTAKASSSPQDFISLDHIIQGVTPQVDHSSSINLFPLLNTLERLAGRGGPASNVGRIIVLAGP